MKINNLHGWQRLWVIISIIWAIPVVVYQISELDTKLKINSEWVWAKIELLKMNDGKEDEYSGTYRQERFGDSSDEEILKFTPERFKKVKTPDLTAKKGHIGLDELILAYDFREYDKMNKKYESRIRELPRSWLQTIFFGFIAWVAPLILIYLMGIGIHWVYDGFRKKNFIVKN